jgi:hypothetical protein
MVIFEAEPSVVELLDKVKKSKLSGLEVKVGDFILTSLQEENMQRYIRFGKVSEVSPSLALNIGYNINIMVAPKVDVLRSQRVCVRPDDNAYKLNENEIALMTKFLTQVELKYLNDCL